MSKDEKNNATTRQHSRPGPGMHGRGGMFVGLEKPKHFKVTLYRLLTYLRPHLWALIFVFTTAIIGTVFAVFGPKVMGMAITVLFEGAYENIRGNAESNIDFNRVAQLLLVLGGLYVTSSLFQFLQQFTMAKVAQQTVYDLREAVFSKINRLPIRYFDERPYGEVLSRVTNDIDTIATTLQQSITQFITSFITLVGISIMMFLISPVLTLIAVISIPLSFFIIRPLLKRSHRYFAQQQKTLGVLNGHVEEMYTGNLVVKAYGREKQSLETFDEMNKELYDAGRRAQFISGIMMPLMGFIGNISYVIISIVGGIFVVNRTITIGDIQAFITYTKQFSQPIAQTANIANIIQSTIAAAERVFEILDEVEEVEVDVPETIADIRGNVRFEHVAFGYGDALLMEDVHIDIKSGQTVAIVGPTGAGKTTLINLLLRFYELNGGKIIIDGVNIAEMKREYLRSLFGVVLQDTWLFRGTIKDNIAYGRASATDEEVYEAAKAAYAHHFIQTLPDGYDTVLNEEVSNISAGQKQLLAIARAMVSDAPILILDEATSSVDTRTEIHIQRAMNELMKGRTSFVIAHRLSTIQSADIILVMENGAVVETGTHEQLLQRKGIYTTLYESQFAVEKTS